ncbi:O-methyltransferase [uncultured Algibacter sp.]|uniref:O-methyltransferase n=1 Tax=uncultured Algibacter sp. TaxID=298659 RepID=UPI00262AC080|nr:class I SAM-dependent methyltransferase [uncultured Algibacter sp.]
MWYQILQYFKFLFKSSNQHGVHSPFVYDVITTCFYDKTTYPDYDSINAYRKALLNNKTKIKVTDLGAGSQVMGQQDRLICSIAKNAGTTKKRARLLFRLTQYFKPSNSLELGTSLGIGTYAMGLGHKKGTVTTIEGCPNTAAFSKKNVEAVNAKNIEFITGDFKNNIENLTTNTYDFIFFDGNHQKEATIHYFETLLKTANNNTVLIFDDIYWSKGMTEAWETIKKHPRVTVSIDTFFWGFIFFRTEQVKEHFIVRV